MMQLKQDDDELAAGLEEIKRIKRMEYLMSKAPCIARLDELAAWAAKDEFPEVCPKCRVTRCSHQSW